MIIFLDKVKAKIKEKLNPEYITIIDKSSLHKKHKSYSSNKFHLKIIIKSDKLKKMEKIEAHKIIFTLLKNEIENKIHALEIEIK